MGFMSCQELPHASFDLYRSNVVWILILLGENRIALILKKIVRGSLCMTQKSLRVSLIQDAIDDM